MNETDKHCKQFMIVKPSITDDQCDPEEGVYSMVTEDIWQTHLMDDGIIEDDYQIRKVGTIFSFKFPVKQYLSGIYASYNNRSNMCLLGN